MSRLLKKNTHSDTRTHVRVIWMRLGSYILLGVIICRLFYWQIIKGAQLRASAEQQYTSISQLHGSRGKIFMSDGHLLVGNQKTYTLFAQPQILKQPPSEIAKQIEHILYSNYSTSTSEAKATQKAELLDKLSQTNKKWIALSTRVSEEQKQEISRLNITGLGFDEYESRYYPEASLGAHLTGFVGKNNYGKDTGYFGVEGKFNLELSSQETVIKTQQDAKGVPLFHTLADEVKEENGRDITLTIRRDIQYMLEKKLAEGVKKYGATSGEVGVMDPTTGNILGLAVYPGYDQSQYALSESALFKNPFVADAYEPGSTFKVITVAAGIDAGQITPETECTNCSSARKIANYTIKTWDDTYHPNIMMKDALAKSDNVAMIFIAEKLGIDRFTDYIKKFKIGEETGIGIQEEAAFPLRKDWKPIDLATSSFGQGIATTGIQMLQAVGAIANQGKMMKPKIVEAVSINGQMIPVKDELVATPISSSSARTTTEMMVYAAQKGEAQWTTSKKYTVAGKTGTAQVPVSGHYDKEKTMASYVGFAPAYNPRFVMLVKLREPKSSQWASETAAPLWYDIAEELCKQLNIPPDRISPTTSP